MRLFRLLHTLPLRFRSVFQFADPFRADVRLAIRQARKHLSYSLTCIAVLAFGLAATPQSFRSSTRRF